MILHFSSGLVRGNPSSDCGLPDSLKETNGRKTEMTKIQEPQLSFSPLFAGIGLEFELGHLLNKNLASLPAEILS